MKRRRILLAVVLAGSFLLPSTAMAQQVLVVRALVEKKVLSLPARPLYWRVESFPTLAQAQGAAGPYGLAAQSGGKAWPFTLGSAGGSSAGGTKVVEVGPLPLLVAAEYLLRINEATAPPGASQRCTPIRAPRCFTCSPESNASGPRGE